MEDIAQLVLEAHKTFDQEYTFQQPLEDDPNTDYIIFKQMRKGNSKRKNLIEAGAAVKMRGCVVNFAKAGTAGKRQYFIMRMPATMCTCESGVTETEGCHLFLCKAMLC